MDHPHGAKFELNMATASNAGESGSFPPGCCFSALKDLYDDSITAKILRVAVRGLIGNVREILAQALSVPDREQNPPTAYPEQVPQMGPEANRYVFRDKDFWACGFFPGSIYSLVERLVKFPQAAVRGDKGRKLTEQLVELGRAWSDPLFVAANRTDTHDMSFMI